MSYTQDEIENLEQSAIERENLLLDNERLEKEIQELKAKVEKLESKLIFSHSFILNLMDNWNYLRDVLSNVSTKKYDDGQIEWTDCCDLEMDANDFYKAKRLSENFAMGNFKEWFHEIKVTYGHKSLDDHEDFKDQYWRRGLKEIKEVKNESNNKNTRRIRQPRYEFQRIYDYRN